MVARLISFTDLAPGVRHFVFEASGIQQLNFEPGQFVSFTAPVDGKPITRAYSLAAAPSGTNRFELCLNRVDDGCLSPRLFAMAPGDVIEMQPPLGTFVLRQPPRDSVLVATGTGIAPFRAYLQAYLREGSPAFTLLFGVRHESHIYYRAEFEAMAARYSHFRFLPVVSRPDAGWTGRTGHVQQHLDEAIAGRKDIDFYLCGLKAMVDDVRSILKSKGVDRKHIRYERYD